MPFDTSKSMKHAGPSRRTFRKLSTEDEIELKRARGEVSCAECRRLKLKCDKKLPCGSCVRRGCPTICPNGSLSTGQGTRFVLADTEHLHRKISDMGQRIRQLEDALFIFQAGVSNETHPLLTEELLAIKFGPEAPKSPISTGPTVAEPPSIPLDALGTLTIGDSGESKYFGRSAGSETLLLAGTEFECTGWPAEEQPPILSELKNMPFILPLGLGGTQDPERMETIMNSLLDLLPPYPRATTLCETYMEQAAWIFRPMQRDEVIDDIMIPIYKYAKARKEDIDQENKLTCPPHKLSVLYMIFAQGALMDLTLPPYNSEAENYFYLGRLSLSLRSAFDLPTTETLQSLCLMAYYHSNGGRRYTLDGAWCLISLASKLAQSIGLHRDPTRWNMSPKIVQRRRNLFWEIFSTDLFHSLALGRPPSIRLSYIDCEFPDDETTVINDKGEVEMGFWRWKHTFTRDVFMQVTELTLTAAPPSYETILELDRKVREKVLPPSLNVYCNTDDEFCTPSVYMRGRLLSQFRVTTMLYIHRSFFAQAMLDYPANPLRSPYAPSFLAAYRCASSVIKTTIGNFQRFPELLTRWWTIWTHLFSAAIVVGVIVTRAPSSTMASAALIELDLAVDLFAKGATHSRRARSGVAILSKLKVKAFQVYSQFRSGAVLSVADQRSIMMPEIGGEDELAVFGGQTRTLVSKILSQSSRRKMHSSTKSADSPKSSASTPSSTSTDEGSHSEPIPEVHPSLVEFLSLLPSSSSTSTQNYNNHNPRSSSTAFDSGLYSMQMDMPSYSLPNLSPSPMAYDQNNAFGNFSDVNMAEGPSTSMPDAGSAANFIDMDMGMILSGDSGIDERWMSFMRDSGILDSNFNGVPNV
ncbi:hypothetical protein SERLA73DRAFT_177669 [Serpula lacrymans var. lacrymans S7.3]|uniref:Zn(2)-C6 fungal-type domain-containing protein n=2 Tax=Serpula lacrymans var. lacrymans TaxID=341189 RepID=F8PPA8_SERL3|nr:uncharacterized protein SERLADRAFT_461394 [Serpula lacrymans var. lacrymans S7.9]EGO01985.1 hypothetical protein SERLA73DRAFT_177669 [Serpula lacrymans var. lacrymans S7.3]EGO27609.1 hypothetical protein SERLADRAFT_461394 [Serpula lacrymans var. lacrymans S7.9]